MRRAGRSAKAITPGFPVNAGFHGLPSSRSFGCAVRLRADVPARTRPRYGSGIALSATSIGGLRSGKHSVAREYHAGLGAMLPAFSAALRSTSAVQGRKENFSDPPRASSRFYGGGDSGASVGPRAGQIHIERLYSPNLWRLQLRRRAIPPTRNARALAGNSGAREGQQYLLWKLVEAACTVCRPASRDAPGTATPDQICIRQ